VPVDSTQYSSGASVTVRGNIGYLTKDNYDFAGWNTQPDGYGTIYNPGDSFYISANTTLYARWWPKAHGISLGIGSDPIPNNYLQFPAADFGYDADQLDQTIRVTNTENQPTGSLTVTVSPAGSFIVDALIPSIAVGYFATFSIRPATGLPGGQQAHTAEVTVSGDGGITASFTVSFTVHPPVITINTQPAATTSVEAGSISGSLNVAASVTLGATLNYQWFSNTTNSNVSGTPVTGATSASFTIPTNLTAGTYFYYCVVSATGGAISEPSNVARVIVSLEMVWVDDGTFDLGRCLGNSANNVTNLHQVTLTQGFHIGKFPVTQEQFQIVMTGNTNSINPTPSNFTVGMSPLRTQDPVETNALHRPVERVSWYDAIVFCNLLSMQVGFTPAYEIQCVTNGEWTTDPARWGAVPTTSNARWNAVRVVAGSTGYRLPTEAQWEFAAKARSNVASGSGFQFSGSNTATDVAWHSANSGSSTRQVGLLQANGLGIHDMSGNVWEWCWDWFGYYTAGAKTDPTGAVFGTFRVMRGGPWSSSAVFSRSVYRSDSVPFNRFSNFGFRVVRP